MKKLERQKSCRIMCANNLILILFYLGAKQKTLSNAQVRGESRTHGGGALFVFSPSFAGQIIALIDFKEETRPPRAFPSI